MYQASGFDWPELAKPHLRPNLAQDIDDAADQPGRGVDRVNPVAFVIVLLARSVGIAIAVVGRQVAVIDIAITVPGRPLADPPSLSRREAAVVLLGKSWRATVALGPDATTAIITVMAFISIIAVPPAAFVLGKCGTRKRKKRCGSCYK